MNKVDFLSRIDSLRISYPAINLSIRDLYDWMLSIQDKEEERDLFSEAMNTFVQDQLGVKVEGQEYADWLAKQPNTSPQMAAWSLQALALWKAYEYRQSQKE